MIGDFIMKEGYIQGKIQEFDYKLKQQIELIEYLKNELQLFQLSKKEQKDLVKKLRDIDKLKDEIILDIKKENKKILDTSFKESKDIVNKLVSKTVEKSIEKIKHHIDRSIEETKNELDIEKILSKYNQRVLMVENLCQIILEELVNQRVISSERMKIIQKRAEIRTRKE